MSFFLPAPRLLATLTVALGLAAGSAAVRAQQPVPGAPDWLLFDHLPGVEGRACMVRTNGPETDTMLTFNNVGVPLLIAGWADRYNEGGEAEVGLSIDGAAPVRLRASIALNLVITSVEDPALARRLRAARSLDWTFPFGRFRANVTGLGTALEALRACRDGTPVETGTR
jgi:hypothetical protein